MKHSSKTLRHVQPGPDVQWEEKELSILIHAAVSKVGLDLDDPNTLILLGAYYQRKMSGTQNEGQEALSKTGQKLQGKRKKGSVSRTEASRRLKKIEKALEQAQFLIEEWQKPPYSGHPERRLIPDLMQHLSGEDKAAFKNLPFEAQHEIIEMAFKPEKHNPHPEAFRKWKILFTETVLNNQPLENVGDVLGYADASTAKGALKVAQNRIISAYEKLFPKGKPLTF